MGAISAGLVVYRRNGSQTEFLLGHPGGPLWARKNFGAWMVPKGGIEPGEQPLAAAIREFQEETGLMPPPITHALSPLKQSSRKTVLCWAAEGDLHLETFSPGAFEMEWPPRSGMRAVFPELDKVSYFEASEALAHILPAQAPLIRETLALLDEAG